VGGFEFAKMLKLIGICRMRIDSHQHFWKYSPADYPWITGSLGPLKRDFLPADLDPELKQADLAGTVAVQARQNLHENDFLLALASAHPVIKGVVGWIDLQKDEVEDQLRSLARQPKFVGVRHVVQDEPDENFVLRPGFIRGISRLKQFHLTYDLLVFPRQLPACLKLVRQFPEQAFVLDHMAKPLIREQKFSPWKEQVAELAKFPNVLCKISGIVTEANWQGWSADDFRPYLDHVFEIFGPDRLMYGSDWPVCLLAGKYQQVFDLANDYIRQFPAELQKKVLGENATRFYSLRE
jgi:L-fuconolactonase